MEGPPHTPPPPRDQLRHLLLAFFFHQGLNQQLSTCGALWQKWWTSFFCSVGIILTKNLPKILIILTDLDFLIHISLTLAASLFMNILQRSGDRVIKKSLSCLFSQLSVPIFFLFCWKPLEHAEASFDFSAIWLSNKPRSADLIEIQISFYHTAGTFCAKFMKALSQ